MSDVVPDLWPDDIEVENVLPPLSILQSQAERLRTRSNGVLVGEVVTRSDGDETEHAFNIVAPALDDYRYHLFTVRHERLMVYPAHVVSSVLSPGQQLAPTQVEFMDRVFEVLRSANCRSVIHSLIARSNEALRQNS